MKKGQVAIIVLLVSAVVMTVGLSLSKKATIETKIDTNEELLKKAFNAAESGIDFYLGTGRTSYSSPDAQSIAEVRVSDIGASGSILDFGEYVPEGGTEYYWLVNHLDNGDLGSVYYNAATVSVCGTGFTGSMEINYFYKTGSDYGVSRYGYNFSSVAANRVNDFNDVSGSCATLTLANSPILISLTPIFNGGRFYLTGTGTFPNQGVEISSTGRSGGVSTEVSGARANKTITVMRRYKIPSFMLTGVVSETSVLSD